MTRNPAPDDHRPDNHAHPDPGFFGLIRKLINLRADTDRDGTIELIKSNVEFRSASAWTLIFAIFIASVGLNVNSTAVIIGAMLISPLMGPISGIGLALGTYDFQLLRKSAKNLGAAVFISILASTLYFLLSPLSEVQSELLARTRPSFFDVLIAFFGGAAGIVAVSRKERGNAIPGVAIATALMPPLCTAGFGLATRNFGYFFGALYLFAINSVFISISTFIFVRYLGFHKVNHLEPNRQRTINRWVAMVGTAVLVPSFFMAWYLQRESFFRSQAERFIRREIRSGHTLIVDQEVIFRLQRPQIRVTILGAHLNPGILEQIRRKAADYGLDPEAIEIQQSTLSEALERRIEEKIVAAGHSSHQLELQLQQKEAELKDLRSRTLLAQQISKEASAVFSKLARVIINGSIPGAQPLMDQKPELVLISGGDKLNDEEPSILIEWRERPNSTELKKASDFISARTGQVYQKIAHVLRLKASL